LSAWKTSGKLGARADHVNRTWITETFTLNVEIIVKYGSKEDLEVLLHYTQGFEDVLPEGIANSIEEVRKRIA
jgi:hypothetical protein